MTSSSRKTKLRGMDLNQWLTQPENTGKTKWLAEMVGKSVASIYLWRSNGVPFQYMQRVSDLTAGQVTVQDMLAHKLAAAVDRSKTAEPAQEGA